MKYITSIMLLAFFAISACAHEIDPQDNVSVVGVGEVEAEPDQAILMINVKALAPDLATAKKQADDKYIKVLSVIKSAGLKDRQIKATRINAQPQYEWRTNKRQYTGELVSRSLSLTVNDLDIIPELMQSLVENDVSSIDGMQTGFKDRKKLEMKALELASKDAKDKAKFLAEQLNRNLGSAYLISENNNSAPVLYQHSSRMASSAMTDESAAPPEMVGTQKIRASINVKFNLL